MAIRDLGYKPYEGTRLPASRNTWVFFKHGVKRAWASWLVKLSIIISVLPLVIYLGMILLNELNPAPEVIGLVPRTYTRAVFDFQLWFFISMVTMGAGAGVISRDLSLKAFQFYLAKPVTPFQYLAGRIGAVSVFCLILSFVAPMLCVLFFTGLAQPDERLAAAALVLPTTAYAVIMAAVFGVGSVAISSLGRSRAMTMSAWAIILILPHIIGWVVESIADWPWVNLLSIPALLGAVGDAIFQVPEPSPLPWWAAAAGLTLVVVGGSILANFQLRRAEVVT